MIRVVPGDVTTVPPSNAGEPSSSSAVRVGPGLLRGVSMSTRGASATTTQLVATKAGILGAVRPVDKGKGKAKGVEGRWIESDTRRYTPQVGDSVVCQITNRNPETYICTLLTSYHHCTLPALSFEGATKRSKPNLKIGTLIYAKIIQADRHSEPELTCVDPQTGKADGLGELKVNERDEGICRIYNISLALASSLLVPSHPLLPSLSTQFPFEAAVGHNGIVWVRAATPRHVVAVGKVLEAAGELSIPSILTGRSSTKSATADMDVDMQSLDGAGLSAQELVKLRGRLPEQDIVRIVQRYVN
ncbi:hypothetical protein K437DRAFT_233119 [Tilletiaria anomala UBC 951]|uniref:K Homology domain-containing protein n=1 Tax=Tilletiaria anomala (strain ATCC 24038 / CBS 436.72 / UBC 951) TaxID=1037660 RepID=A0A066WCD0_TILAU|nr:uncharacterized protein K437DRAFT_233119 [Tilletiaria anomala UBC 951]KDN51376.1 hypothetical protein K437DRAFT_233119 [Tilletiaria anomala UBC 951]